MNIQEVTIELSYPPPTRDNLVAEMRAAIDRTVPTGQRVVGLHGAPLHIGPDLDDDLTPCYRMKIRYKTVEVGPMTWEGQD